MSHERKFAFFCGDIPHEIFHAANIRLKRINGDGQPAHASKRFFPTYMCSYAMNCLDIILNEAFDGFILTNQCHAMQTLFEICREHFPDATSIMINHPRVQSDFSLQYFQNELQRVFSILCKGIDNQFFYASLQDAVTNAFEIQSLKRQTMEKIKASSFSLTKPDIDILEFGFIEDPASYSKKCQDFMQRMDVVPIDTNHKKPRILLSGMILSPLDIMDVITAYGGNVVHYDSFRLTNKINDGDVSCHPLEIIAQNHFPYTEQDNCNWNNGWLNEFKRTLIDYSIDSVVISLMKFCPNQSYGILLVAELLKSMQIPFLVIDDSFSDRCSAQIHTRIQAFMECIT